MDVITNLEDDLCCPITRQIFNNPVIIDDGFTYEKKWIKKWLKNNNKSPMTNQKLKSKICIPNYSIKKLVDDYNEICLKNTNLQNSLNTVKNLVEKFGFNTNDSTGKSLIQAILEVTYQSDNQILHDKIIDFFIDKHIECNLLKNKYKYKNNLYKLIHFVCIYGKEKHLIKLSLINCNFESQMSNGYRPIHLLCKYGDYDSIKYLISKVNLTKKTKNGLSIIEIISMYGDEESIKFVIEYVSKKTKIKVYFSRICKFLKMNKKINLHTIRKIENYCDKLLIN